MAQIDTGSNYCFFPGEVIEDIGGKLERGRIAPIKVIGGEYTGYVHSVKMEVLKTGVDGRPASDEDGNKVVFCQMPETEMIFIPKSESGYIGVAGFLERCLLRIDYPRSYFSIQMNGT
jgi:hypothetical protein